MPAQSDPSQTDSECYPALIVPTIGTWPRFDSPLRLGVMASGTGTNFEALHDAIACGDLDAQIHVLVVNNPGCGASERASRLGIRCELRDHRLFASREAMDQELVRTFQSENIEAVVMAGWMRIVTPVLIDAYPGRLINIHPSLLPSFRGMDAIGQCLTSGVTIAGCTVHEVLNDVDAGPILAQAAVPVLPGDDRETLKRRIQRQEHRLLPWATAMAGQRWRSARNTQG
ncbi:MULTISPECIES: phosphoribosylglycinamide formyltransferase [unclassified Synechococcus]|uniref:phosphoribosylglycinamide formyltransferase n=1 Tax=unclassified Synechococcus TaxID=2626047 RepID=UPI0008367F74|nr:MULTISPECIES: phosphoribosylglycinamide formyltransferase [unclassified Synechococcus]